MAQITKGLPFLMPEYILLCGILLLTLGSVLPKVSTFGQANLTFLVVLLGGLSLLFQGHETTQTLFSNVLLLDKTAFVNKSMMFVASLFTLPFAYHYEKPAKEWYILFLGVLLGASLMCMANNLIMMIIAMELLSISAYLLTGLGKEHRNHTEAAIKYILFGMFATAVMIYGISWWYGLVGSFDFIPHSLEKVAVGVQILVISLVFVGFFFKIGAVPFHFWQPDVYDGLAYPTVAFFATVPKIAAMAMLTRFVGYTYEMMDPFYVQLILGIISVLSMTVGNLLALNQTHTKRMLAYSSIAHTGFLLLPLITLQAQGSQGGLLFYLLIYVSINFAAFLMAGIFHHHALSDNMSELNGKATKHTLWATAFIIVLVALIGLPPTAGFIAKWFVFLYLIQTWSNDANVLYLILLIAAALNTVISLFYYLKIPSLMVFKPSHTETAMPQFFSWQTFMAVFLATFALILGIIGFDTVMNFFQR
ncbi:MAG: NADH-quinone oxidoreductase subunit N [Bacteroidia bacterium]